MKCYIKPIIEIISVDIDNLIMYSGNGKYRYIRDYNGETIESDYDERQNSTYEEIWKNLGDHGYDPDGNRMFSKKNNLWN